MKKLVISALIMLTAVTAMPQVAKADTLKGQAPTVNQNIRANYQAAYTNIYDFNLTRILQQGCVGEDVRKVQEYLNFLAMFISHDYNCGQADGIFGPKTEAAVIAFQAREGLIDDGKIGPVTKARLVQRVDEAHYLHG